MGILQNIREIIGQLFDWLRRNRVLRIVMSVLLKIITLTIAYQVIRFRVRRIWGFLSRRREENEDTEDGDDHDDNDIEQLRREGMPVRYNHAQLTKATREFGEKIGSGGFGCVFRGTLENRQEIAVKCLDGSRQGNKEFAAEVRTLGSIHHINLVKLIGFCAEKKHRELVYEFMCNGSLDNWIFHRDSKRNPLDWVIRERIILEIAKGLAYLHEDCTQMIVHLDIKPQNILLGPDLHVKISDFGLSRLIDRVQSQVATRARGTFGYMAPEVCLRAAISVKADVYSFGVVVMEIVCGRKNLDGPENKDLVSLLMEKANEEELLHLVDQSTRDMKLHEAEAVEMLRLAIWCLQRDPNKRPRMSTVVKVLEGTAGIEAILEYDNDNSGEVIAMSVEASVLSGPR